jgi:hypothetical protein
MIHVGDPIYQSATEREMWSKLTTVNIAGGFRNLLPQNEDEETYVSLLRSYRRLQDVRRIQVHKQAIAKLNQEELKALNLI